MVTTANLILGLPLVREKSQRLSGDVNILCNSFGSLETATPDFDPPRIDAKCAISSCKATYGDQPVCAYAMVGPALKFLLTSPVPIIGQDTSQIQRQHLFEFSHNQDFPFGICFPIERHHASD